MISDRMNSKMKISIKISNQLQSI